jgi:pSer/pThr/pTyr-binding forkhead associated (FHA) protein
MNAVAPPPSVHSVSRSWNGGALDSMSSEIFLPRNKSQQRYGSLSGHSPASSSENNAMSNSAWASSLKKKGAARVPGGAGGGVGTNGSTLGGWPKSDVASRSNGMGPGVATQSPSPTNGIHQPNPILPSQHLANSQMQNGHTQPSFLVLLPLNGTFERKQIPLPYFSETLRIGRQTNNKTTPTQSNGYFDSKVLSRQHAEVWADKETNKVWIRDIKSSNGTFVNGQRLSQENQASEPHELRTDDVLELGIDIVGEDSKTIIHHKVAARVEHAGVHVGNIDLSFADVEPLVNGSLMTGNHGSAPNGVRGRTNSQNSTRTSVANGMTGPNHRQAPMIVAPVSMEMVVKKLNV